MKKFLPAILLLLCASPAFAWNCSDPLASRVPVPAGTAGSFGNGDGQLFLGTGTEGVKGQLYQCQVPKPDPTPTKTKGAPVYQNQTQTQTSSSNSTASSAANAQGGNSTSNSNSQGGNATGGSVSGSGNSQSTLRNSGNSSNTNTNSAAGGAGGAASANNDSSGNVSTYDSNTTVEASKIPVATALAVAPPATSPCVVGFGGGVQTMAFGGSLSGGKIDKNCAILETARSFASMNARLAYCKTMLINKFAKQAGITLEDCMRVPQAVIIPAVQAPPPPVTPTPIIINVPAQAAIIPAVPATVESVGTLHDLGSFRVTRSYSTNLCPTVQVVLGPNGVQILNRAIALSGEVTLIGNVYTTAVATSYLRKHGVSKVVVKAADEQDNSVGVQVWSIQ